MSRSCGKRLPDRHHWATRIGQRRWPEGSESACVREGLAALATVVIRRTTKLLPTPLRIRNAPTAGNDRADPNRTLAAPLQRADDAIDIRRSADDDEADPHVEH